jgi:hypothetical protein
MKKSRNKIDNYTSLFDVFEPGQRVKRIFTSDDGIIEEYEGIIMAMDNEKMEIYWDTLDGQYCPELIEEDFTMCCIDEVFNGSEEFSPIKKKTMSFIDYF